MKKLLTILTIIILPFCMYGQKSAKQKSLPVIEFNENVNLPLTALERSQIEEVYGDYANKFVYSDPFRLKSIKNILRNRVVIEQLSAKNVKTDCKKLSEVDIQNNFVSDIERDQVFDIKTFNPLKYCFNFYSNTGYMYKVDNTNFYITIKSQYQ